MAGIGDVARLAGVSTATVSRALSGRGQVSPATRERVMRAADSLGYVVSAAASSLSSGRARNIGVLVPHLDRWFFATVLSAIAAALMQRGYDITLYTLTPDAGLRRSVFETFLKRQRVDGVIVLSIELDADELRRLGELALPVIAIGGPHSGLPTLAVDDVAVARLATEHLIGLGHRSIAHIGATREYDLDFHIPTRRRQGFEQALHDAGITVDPSLFEAADFTIEGGFDAAARLLSRPGGPPTAIFAASDEMAVGAILAAREAGLRVPDDLSVIGVDGHELGRFFRLTTIDQFPAAQGERAVTALVGRIEHADAAAAASADPLPYALVVRESTAAVPVERAPSRRAPATAARPRVDPARPAT